MKKIKSFFGTPTYVVLFSLLIISFYSFIVFFSSGQNLYFADAMSRLDIARKVIDNLNPGLPQLGSVWLPLPQLLMIPFIWNNWMWHTGLAGSIMSMTMFILGGYFIYQSARLITGSIIGSVLSLSIYALNINVLYLQTTAMSESLFLCTLAGTIYYFIKWFQSNERMYLVPAAFAVSAMTLDRYEGLAVLLSAVPMVFVYTFIKTKSYKRAEGNTIFFTTLAGLGFALWTLYLTVIFGDPLYWKDYYATPQATGGAAVKVYSQHKPLLAAVWEYFTSYSWMVGIIPAILSSLGIISLIYYSIKRKSWIFLPMLMPLSLYLFMVLTLQRNTPIVQPALNFSNIFSSTTSGAIDFNMRYGILLLPWTAIITAFIFKIFNRKKIQWVIYSLFILIFGIQIFSYAYPKYTTIYQFPYTHYGKPYIELVDYMHQHYNGGEILISAGAFEDQMFLMGYNYRTYIHEGAGKYWKESLDEPSKYATWIIVDYAHPQDSVAKILNQNKLRDFNVVYHHSTEYIYKVKTKPWINIYQ